MAKVTSKYQVTVPKVIADQYSIHPGDDIEWVPAGESIRVVPGRNKVVAQDRESRLRLFDQATERQRKRTVPRTTKQPRDRGWTREDLYARVRSH
jgi:bifunctional DNA-binding transcriptional regulator/antitoxin component of YhaV-PrlF toxin-antitoxin module